MSLVAIEPKYTYSSGHKTIFMPYSLQNDGTQNYNLWTWNALNYASWDMSPLLVSPAFILPSVGLGKDDRVGNKITIDSIRIRMYITMSAFLCSSNYGNPFWTISEPGTYNGTEVDNQSHFNYPRRWFKLRFLVVKFQESTASDMNPQRFMSWFYATYLPFKDTQGTTPAAGSDENVYAPVSVHSKMLHMVSDYTGKFNIVVDKCITLYSNNSQILIDYTLPMHKTMSWLADGSVKPTGYVMVLLPPLNGLSDIDGYTWQQYNQAKAGGYLNINKLPMLYRVDWFEKMNFTDL